MAKAMTSDDAVTVEVIDQTHDGKGVADLDGRRIFIAGALPGERAVIASRRRRRRYQEATLLEIDVPSQARVDPVCEFFGVCGGCALQHMSYDAQVEFKQHVVAESFARIGKLAPDRWHPPLTGPEWRYRRRARLGVKFVEGKGRVLVGFRERAAPFITDMDHCPVLARPLDTGLAELAAAVAATSLRARIPQIEVAIGDDCGAIVFRTLDAPTAEDVGILAELGGRLGLDVYFQPGGPGSVRPITSEPHPLRYSLPGFGLRLGFAPTDFIQVNAVVNSAMVARAVENAEIAASDRVLDLFCGIGNFSLPFAQTAGQLLGVEGEPGLVARALRNADANAIENAKFTTADLAESNWPFLKESWDIVLLDPPRTGADAVVAQMATMAPRRVVYVSCHPGTLARDARILTESQGYRLASAQILDMFPHTHHVEVMAVFDRRD